MTISIPCRKKSVGVLREHNDHILHRHHHVTLNANVHRNEVYQPGSSVGIATDYGLDGSGSNPVQTGPGAHPASCKMGTGSFLGRKVQPGRAADHSLPSSVAVMEEYSYTSTHPLGHTGPVTGSLYLLSVATVHLNISSHFSLRWDILTWKVLSPLSLP